MACKGICKRIKEFSRVVDRKSMIAAYAKGMKRCQICEMYTYFPGKFCPCCGMPMRTRLRQNTTKKLRSTPYNRI